MVKVTFTDCMGDLNVKIITDAVLHIGGDWFYIPMGDISFRVYRSQVISIESLQLKNEVVQ